MLNTLWRVGVGASLAALLCAVALRWLGEGGRGTLAAEAAVVGSMLLLALGAGYGAMKLLRVEELATVEQLVRSLTRRLRGR